MGRWDSDKVLRAIEAQPEPIGTLVRAFPGEAAAVADQNWIDSWFADQAKRLASGNPPEVPKIVVSAADASVLDPLARRAVTAAVKLLSLQPNYFRGFRASAGKIYFGESLVVVEGANSSGKTSISEAIEWLLTGKLSRRLSGHPKELANCIANQFRPKSESTWVECLLEIDGNSTVLRRVLDEDYTELAGSAAKSTLHKDGSKLTDEEGRDLLDKLFGGVHPILMQHTLREFVYSTPSERRRYFERLLEIDQLTSLIERAVVGDQRLNEFVSPATGATRRYLSTLAGACKSPVSIKILKDLEKSGEQAHRRIIAVLEAIAESEFGVTGDIASVRQDLENQQRETREKQFPSLQFLRSPSSTENVEKRNLLEAAKKFQEQIAMYGRALEAVAAITSADRIMSRAADELGSLGLLEDHGSEYQLCPLCQDERRTLGVARLETLRRIGPLATALSSAELSLQSSEQRWHEELKSLTRNIQAFAPHGINDSGAALEALAEVTRPIARTAVESAEALRLAAEACSERIAAIDPRSTSLEEYARLIDNELSHLNSSIVTHRQALATLERHLGVGASDDPDYVCREAWIQAVIHAAESADQIIWDSALKKAQGMLVSIRKGFIELRSAIIEGARASFSQAMAEVWNELRADAGGKFKEISIPPARGKGYKLEFEVKATLSDGAGDTEVDALRVFSESQVNVIGIAAYVTRAQALGHTLLVFDDPVQSMDEEHFKSLAGKLIPILLEKGCQVIVLTHSDSFARDLSLAHYDRISYATLRTRFSKRHGCCVDEGSRRVSERLKTAEALAEDGQLGEAWLRIRFAVERLYTVAMKAANPTFNPDSWRNKTAEDMWNQGAGSVITERVAGSAVKLKQIISASAKAAHDTKATSHTEIVEAIKFLKTLLTPLRVGNG